MQISRLYFQATARRRTSPPFPTGFVPVLREVCLQTSLRPTKKTSDYFGELVFDRPKMHKYLDADTLKALLECIDKGVALDRKTADGVALGMKQWAMEHGVTHVTHWFQPLTEGTAEKHDSLIDYDGKGGVIEKLSGL